MMRHIRVSLLVVVLAGVAALAQSPGLSPDARKLEIIDQFLTGLSADGFSGSVLVSDGTNMLRKCYGLADRARAIRCDENTAFDIGSVTKQFTGAAVLKLEMQGKLAVTDRIDRFLKDAPPDKGVITVHQLLTHSSGLPPAVGGDYEVLSRDAFLKRVWSTPLAGRPGNAYEYSNVGYSVLAALVEMVSGQSYEHYLREQLFTPAGMTHTGYRLPAWGPTQVAVGYRGESAWGKPNEKPWDTTGPYWNLLGNGGILSTTGDLFRWHQALLGDSILNAPAKTKYYTRHIEEGAGAGTFYGYGWALFPTPRNTTLITHNGGNGIFFADVLRYVDEKVTIIFLTNAARPEFRTIPREIAQTLFRPDYRPSLNLQAPTTVASWDGHPQGALLRDFIATMTTGDRTATERFVRDHFSPALVAMAPMERHLEMLGTVGSRIKGLEMATIEVSGARTVISFRNQTLKLSIMVEQGKIAGLGME